MKKYLLIYAISFFAFCALFWFGEFYYEEVYLSPKITNELGLINESMLFSYIFGVFPKYFIFRSLFFLLIPFFSSIVRSSPKNYIMVFLTFVVLSLIADIPSIIAAGAIFELLSYIYNLL